MILKRFFSYIILHLLFAITICFLFRWVLLEWNALTEHDLGLSDVYYLGLFLSTIIWMCIVLILLYLIIKRLGFDYKKVFGFSLVVAAYGLIVWLPLFFFTNIFNKSLVPKEYVGIYGYNEYEDENGNVRSGVKPYYVYHKGDKRIESELTKILEYHDDAYKEEFLFWQTAYVTGYDPKFVKQYIMNDKSQKTELIITSGLLALIESFVNGLLPAILYLILPAITFLFNKPLLFKNIIHLKGVIERQPVE